MKEKHLSASAPLMRNSRIELLRIISMLLIVAFHADMLNYTDPTKPTIVWLSGILFCSWGILGVDIFVIISAWFLADQKFRSRRIIHIVFQTLTYILLWVVLSVGYQYIRTKSAVTAVKAVADVLYADLFDPFFCRRYWFITAYFFMLIVSPFLNYILHHADRRMMKKLLIVFAFIPIYSQFQISVISDIAVFCYIFLLTGVLKKYGAARIGRFAKPKYILPLVFFVIIGKILTKFSGMPEKLTKLLLSTVAATGRHSVILFICALLICFYVFSKKPFYSKTVNRVAAYTLGVYLLTELYVLDYYGIQQYIFKKLTWLGFLTEDAFFPLKFTAVVLLVYCFGIGVEFIRTLLLQKPFMKLVDKKLTQKPERIDDWFSFT